MRRARLLLAPFAALVGTLILAAPGLGQTLLSPGEFQDRVGRAEELARLDGTAPSPGRMAELRAVLGLPVHIVIGDWSGVVPKDPILDGLSGSDAADFERAGERLDALRQSLSETIARERHPGASVADALAGAYRGVIPPRPNPLATAMQVFDDIFQAILQRVGNQVANAGNVLAWVVLIGIVVFAAFFLFSSRLVPDRESRADTTGRRGRGSIDWAARAEEALRAGDLTEAVRASYLALLVVLAGRGIISNAPALTAGEARVAVSRTRPALFAVVARATASYERVVYGGATPDRRDVDQLREATAEARKP